AEQELASASKRLSEAFLVGEYLTSLDVVSMPEKHQVLVFLQKSNQLANALQVKDYALAEKLVNEVQTMAKDYDATQARPAIQTANATSAMHLAHARHASVVGDKVRREAELKAATDTWPTNPALTEVASSIYNQANIQVQELAEFDQLVSQRNWRQIYDN